MSRKIIAMLIAVVFFLYCPVVAYAEVQPPVTADLSMYPNEDTTYSKSYKIAVRTAKKYYPDNYYVSYNTFSCDGEICAYTEEGNYYLVSFSPVSINKKLIRHNDGGIETNDSYQVNFSVSNSYGETWAYMNIGSYGGTYLGHEGVLYSEVKVFDSEEHAYAYLKDGTIEGLLTDVMHEYNAGQIYLDNFSMTVHDSNQYDKWYVEFTYEPSSALLESGKLIINTNFDCEADAIASALSLNMLSTNWTHEIDLNQNPNSCKLTLEDFARIDSGDIMPLMRMYYKKAVLGKEAILDLSDISFEGIGGETIGKITKSECYFDIKPVVGEVFGKSYQSYVNILDPSCSYYNSSTPDSAGNYTSDNNYSQNDGYYYTDVQTDAQGNNIYNYYYINNDGISTSVDDTLSGGGSENISGGSDVNVTQTVGNVNVNIDSGQGNKYELEDADFNSIVDSIKYAFGLWGEKDDNGLYQLLKDMIAYLPGEIIVLMCGGIGAVTLISVVKILRG